MQDAMLNMLEQLENIQEKVPYLLEISKKISRRLGAEI